MFLQIPRSLSHKSWMQLVKEANQKLPLEDPYEEKLNALLNRLQRKQSSGRLR